VTQADIDKTSTAFYVSDDPTGSGHVFFSVILADALPVADKGTAIPTAAPASQSLHPVVAELDSSGTHVLRMGYGNWYAGSTAS
jgi:hypothetical protein